MMIKALQHHTDDQDDEALDEDVVATARDARSFTAELAGVFARASQLTKVHLELPWIATAGDHEGVVWRLPRVRQLTVRYTPKGGGVIMPRVVAPLLELCHMDDMRSVDIDALLRGSPLLRELCADGEGGPLHGSLVLSRTFASMKSAVSHESCTGGPVAGIAKLTVNTVNCDAVVLSAMICGWRCRATLEHLDVYVNATVDSRVIAMLLRSCTRLSTCHLYSADARRPTPCGAAGFRNANDCEPRCVALHALRSLQLPICEDALFSHFSFPELRELGVAAPDRPRELHLRFMQCPRLRAMSTVVVDTATVCQTRQGAQCALRVLRLYERDCTLHPWLLRCILSWVPGVTEISIGCQTEAYRKWSLLRQVADLAPPVLRSLRYESPCGPDAYVALIAAVRKLPQLQQLFVTDVAPEARSELVQALSHTSLKLRTTT